MINPSRAVDSNQHGPHEDLLRTVDKHKCNVFQRPIAAHTQHAFEQMLAWLEDWQGDVILDACCGVGESTLNLASSFRNARVVGVDKSAARLQKHVHYAQQFHAESEPLDNYLILQADLNDFWRLLAAHIKTPLKSKRWRLRQQFILYPNPYPKKAQLSKRWHGGAVFPDIVETCRCIEVRSNWKIYIEEFVIAAKALGVQMQIHPLKIDNNTAALTPFERKYAQSGQLLWTATTVGAGCDK